jgi:hypothetical protein
MAMKGVMKCSKMISWGSSTSTTLIDARPVWGSCDVSCCVANYRPAHSVRPRPTKAKRHETSPTRSEEKTRTKPEKLEMSKIIIVTFFQVGENPHLSYLVE